MIHKCFSLVPDNWNLCTCCNWMQAQQFLSLVESYTTIHKCMEIHKWKFHNMSWDLNCTLVAQAPLYLGFIICRLALLSIFHTVRDVVPKAQIWSQFTGLNTKEMTSFPVCGCVQIGSAFSQFLHHTATVTVKQLLSLKKQNREYAYSSVLLSTAYHTVMVWSGREEQHPK